MGIERIQMDKREMEKETSKEKNKERGTGKMKSLIGKEEMNIWMNILKMKKEIEIRKDIIKKGGIERIQMEKETSKEKNKERGTEKEINRDKTEEEKMKEIKKVKALKVKMTE